MGRFAWRAGVESFAGGGAFLLPPVKARLWRVLAILALAGSILANAGVGRAEGPDPQPSARLAHWQIARWSDGGAVCDFYSRSSARPTPREVEQACGKEISQAWVDTPECKLRPGQACAGLLLLGASAKALDAPGSPDGNLPPIQMSASPLNCQPGQTCGERPQIRFSASEPLSGYQIARVHVRVGSTERIYSGSVAQVTVPLTGDQGDSILYWAESSLGDSSETFTLRYRATPLSQNDPPTYRFDLLDARYQSVMAPGVLRWEVFPTAARPLSSAFVQPSGPELLATSYPLIYLAGHLIRSGEVDASSCSDRGLLVDGGASPCGAKLAAARVTAWQNQYDRPIYTAALKYDVPARVLKGMIAQESQFWPVSNDPYEVGLGFMTENGASMLLSWNLDYYRAVCRPLYGATVCYGGYSNLREDRQKMLRGVVFGRMGSSAEIDTLGATLAASAGQTAQLIGNVMHADLSGVTAYDDLWKVTLANYYAGSGCIGAGLRGVAAAQSPLTWEALDKQLTGVCQIADQYVQKVLEFAR